MSAANLTWETALDDVEIRIATGEQALKDGTSTDEDLISSWVPPTELGALPEHLHHRALALQDRLACLVQTMTAARDALGQRSEAATKAGQSARQLKAYAASPTALFFNQPV